MYVIQQQELLFLFVLDLVFLGVENITQVLHVPKYLLPFVLLGAPTKLNELIPLREVLAMDCRVETELAFLILPGILAVAFIEPHPHYDLNKRCDPVRKRSLAFDPRRHFSEPLLARLVVRHLNRHFEYLII